MNEDPDHLIECAIICRPDEPPLFTIDSDSRWHVRMNGYIIMPKELLTDAEMEEFGRRALSLRGKNAA